MGGQPSYAQIMAEITVVAEVPILGLRRNDQVSVEDTPLIQALISGGKLRLVCAAQFQEEDWTDGEPGPEPVSNAEARENDRQIRKARARRGSDPAE